MIPSGSVGGTSTERGREGGREGGRGEERREGGREGGREGEGGGGKGREGERERSQSVVCLLARMNVNHGWPLVLVVIRCVRNCLVIISDGWPSFDRGLA